MLKSLKPKPTGCTSKGPYDNTRDSSLRRIRRRRFRAFLRGRSLKGRCNIRVYIPLCVCVFSCACPSSPPLTPPILWGCTPESPASPPHDPSPPFPHPYPQALARPAPGKNYPCNLCDHLQRCQMPDIESGRKTAEKGAEWVPVKQPRNSRKNNQNTRKTAVLTVFRVFRLFFRLFFGFFLSGPIRHPLRLFFRPLSMSGIRDCKTTP